MSKQILYFFIFLLFCPTIGFASSAEEVKVLLQSGKIYYSKGKYVEAQSVFKRALNICDSTAGCAPFDVTLVRWGTSG